MSVINSFKDMPMFNFGVRVVTNMNDEDDVLGAKHPAGLSLKES